ncbi:MAG: DUF6702 family protein [Pricia sp.]
MKKYLLVLFAGLLSMASFAHSPSTSTTMLVEKENGSWVLQISASLTAFQQEIQTHFSETPYKTPEEFQQMVLEHIKNNLQIRFNDGDGMTLVQGIVKLGHETKVVFEVFGIPSDVRSVRVKNTAFNDIHKSQSALLLFKKGFTKEQFVLDSANDYTLSLVANDNKFVEVSKSKADISENILFLIAFILTAVAFALVAELRPIRIASQNESPEIPG